MANTEWNLLIYANAGDVVIEDAMRNEIAAMRNSALPPDCHIAVQFNTKTAMERHWISDGEYLLSAAEPVDTSTGRELTRFIDAATDQLGRRPTMLVLAAHGSGLDDIRKTIVLEGQVIDHVSMFASGGLLPDHLLVKSGGLLPTHPVLFHMLDQTARWGGDPVSGAFLTNSGLRKAIADSKLRRVEVLAFNACWMGMLEIAFEMRDVATTFVSCQVFAQLWPYGDIAARLAADTTQSPERWAAAFVDAVRSGIAAGRRDDAVSAFRTGQHLTELADAVGAYAAPAMVLIDADWPALSNAINNSPRGVSDPLAADLALLVAAATCGDHQAEQAARAVGTALAAACIDNTSHSSHPGVTGLSIFCPTDVDLDLGAAYRGIEFGTNRWAAFLEKFQVRQAEDLGGGPSHVAHPGHVGL